MTKSKIAIFTITLILLSVAAMAQEVYAPPPQNPEKITIGPVTSVPAIPDWVDQNFRWYGQGLITQTELLNALTYLLENNIMFISEEAANEVRDLRVEVAEQATIISSLRTIVSSQAMNASNVEGGDVEVRGWDYEQKESTSDPESESRVKVKFPWMTADFDFASEIVDDILRKGGTESVWEDGITAFSQHGMSESVIPELAGIVVLCNNVIDKKTQSIAAELKILEQWLEIISEKQESESSDVYQYSRQAEESTTESTSQYRETDLNFISRSLSSINQQINALDTGIMVLEEKLSSVGDDTQLATIDLQNMLQKQQQTLQTMSNVSKAAHDTAMSIIRKIG